MWAFLFRQEMLEKLADKFERKVKCLISTLCHDNFIMIVCSKLQMLITLQCRLEYEKTVNVFAALVAAPLKYFLVYKGRTQGLNH